MPSSTVLPPSPTDTPRPTFTRTSIPTQPTRTPTPTFASPASWRQKGDTLSGTYKLNRDKSEVCVLKVVLEHDEIDFEIFCKHGPPAYTSGHVMAKIAVSGKNAEYASPILKSGESCQLFFQFDGKVVTVKQSGVEIACGFGRGIHADGIYTLIDPKPPILGCMDDDNPCNLDHPIP